MTAPGGGAKFGGSFPSGPRGGWVPGGNGGVCAAVDGSKRLSLKPLLYRRLMHTHCISLVSRWLFSPKRSSRKRTESNSHHVRDVQIGEASWRPDRPCPARAWPQCSTDLSSSSFAAPHDLIISNAIGGGDHQHQGDAIDGEPPTRLNRKLRACSGCAGLDRSNFKRWLHRGRRLGKTQRQYA